MMKIPLIMAIISIILFLASAFTNSQSLRTMSGLIIVLAGLATLFIVLAYT